MGPRRRRHQARAAKADRAACAARRQRVLPPARGRCSWRRAARSRRADVMSPTSWRALLEAHRRPRRRLFTPARALATRLSGGADTRAGKGRRSEVRPSAQAALPQAEPARHVATLHPPRASPPGLPPACRRAARRRGGRRRAGVTCARRCPDAFLFGRGGGARRGAPRAAADVACCRGRRAACGAPWGHPCAPGLGPLHRRRRRNRRAAAAAAAFGV